MNPTARRARGGGPAEAAATSLGRLNMDPRADRRIDEDLRKGAVEADDWRERHEDEAERRTSAVALTEDVTGADTRDIKHAEAELGADEDGTPG